jgi:protein-tyrosine kinase
MAKFRSTTSGMLTSSIDASESPNGAIHDRAIGDILSEAKNLDAEQVEQILAYQVEHGVKFGEAAVALGFARGEDVLWALSQQFHYPYASSARLQSLSTELVLAGKPFSSQAESFRAIRSQLMMGVFNSGGAQRVLAVVSPDTQDGKTFFAANIAVALTQLGGRTLVVDADMRHPRMHEVFGIDNSAGLSGVLSGRVQASVIRPVDELPNLYVLPVGTTPPNPLELVERPAFGLLIKELSSKFDYVIVDTPAAVYGSDAPVIASRCGAALAIARKNRSALGGLYDLVAMLANGHAKLAGAVLNEF